MFFLFRRKERAELKAAQSEELKNLKKDITKSVTSITKNAGKAARIQANLKNDPTYKLILAMGVEDRRRAR